MVAVTICSDSEPIKENLLVSTFSPIYHEVIELDALILIFWMLSIKPAFFTLLFHPHQEIL